MADENSSEKATNLDDLSDYVAAFRASSDRARVAFYVVIVATILIFITNYNTQPGHWPDRRLHFWFPQSKTESKVPEQPSAVETLASQDDRLLAMRDEYIRQFTARSILTESPIPGVSIDANDLGILGGIALILVMIVFVLCVIREHENLYLALYKVRKVYTADGEPYLDGQSRANLLYHSLAMNQVVSSPPTLARWRLRDPLRHFGLTFFLPVVVYAWLVFTDFKTRDIGTTYGVNVIPQLQMEIVFWGVIALLSTVAWLHARAMAKRWRRAFFRINKQRLLVEQASLDEWLKLDSLFDWLPFRRRGEDKEKVGARLEATLIDGVVEIKSIIGVCSVKICDVYAELASRRISRDTIRETAAEIKRRGEAAAKAKCATLQGGKFVALLAFSPTTNTLDEVPDESLEIDQAAIIQESARRYRWTVGGTWTFSLHQST
ncbi:MAG TPA: hypothetical protein VMU84_13265 [Thermoanaerobaculia bacterium]|nr:hypothetical protein [Thermoanaerobaculia bacterium]